MTNEQMNKFQDANLELRVAGGVRGACFVVRVGGVVEVPGT